MALLLKLPLIALIPNILAQLVPLRCQIDPINPGTCEPRPVDTLHRQALTRLHSTSLDLSH